MPRRVNNLFHQIIERENLRVAFYKAAKGRRHYASIRRFADDLEFNLRQLAADVIAGTIRPGQSTQFTIRDPKPRTITAPCFRERVLHHAIMNVCEPVFERSLIDDTYACRIGKGRIACLHRAQRFSRRFDRVLKMDVRKYFDSVPHAKLQNLLRRRFRDPALLRLLDRIIESYEIEPGCGLPIGSLTSQHFANFYLSWLDRFVKQDLRIRGYVRYMDDFVFWGSDSLTLNSTGESATWFLNEQLGLITKPVDRTYATRHGFPMLGCRVFPTHLTLSPEVAIGFGLGFETWNRARPSNSSNVLRRCVLSQPQVARRAGNFAAACYKRYW